MPKVQVAFRPIIGPTEDAAWEKANAIVERIKERRGRGNPWVNRLGQRAPENTGSQRLIEIAQQGERYDRALWTATEPPIN